MQRTGRASAQIDQHPPDPRAGRSSPETCSHATWARIIDSCTTSRAKSRSPINLAAIASRRGCLRRKKGFRSTAPGRRPPASIVLAFPHSAHEPGVDPVDASSPVSSARGNQFSGVGRRDPPWIVEGKSTGSPPDGSTKPSRRSFTVATPAFWGGAIPIVTSMRPEPR